jgi:hypothetical protein
MVSQADWPAQQECGGGGAGQQECPDRVGAVGARPGIPVQLRRRLIGAVDDNAVGNKGNTRQLIPPIAQAIKK